MPSLSVIGGGDIKIRLLTKHDVFSYGRPTSYAMKVSLQPSNLCVKTFAPSPNLICTWWRGDVIRCLSTLYGLIAKPIQFRWQNEWWQRVTVMLVCRGCYKLFVCTNYPIYYTLIGLCIYRITKVRKFKILKADKTSDPVKFHDLYYLAGTREHVYELACLWHHVNIRNEQNKMWSSKRSRTIGPNPGYTDWTLKC